MATTFVQIANRAITFLGATTITALTDDTKEGRSVKRMYEQTRDQVLRDHPWNFAIKRKSVAANTTAPIYKYTNAFDFPDNTLRILAVDTDEEWTIEGRQIVTDAPAPLKIAYLERVIDANLFDASFIEAYAVRLAADIAYDITASQTIVRALEQKYIQTLRSARLADAQEAYPEKELNWVEARN
tara:strand:+ start:651 stop:1205 length:555 start_codon:yes stop_codon:yes gene_type:complete